MVDGLTAKVKIFVFLQKMPIFTDMNTSVKDQIGHLQVARVMLHRCL